MARSQQPLDLHVGQGRPRRPHPTASPTSVNSGDRCVESSRYRPPTTPPATHSATEIPRPARARKLGGDGFSSTCPSPGARQESETVRRISRAARGHSAAPANGAAGAGIRPRASARKEFGTTANLRIRPCGAAKRRGLSHGPGRASSGPAGAAPTAADRGGPRLGLRGRRGVPPAGTRGPGPGRPGPAPAPAFGAGPAAGPDGPRLDAPARPSPRARPPLPVSLRSPGCKQRVEGEPEGHRPERDDAVAAATEQRDQHEPRQDRRPRPQDEDRAPVPVTEAQQPVVDVVLVGRVEAGAVGRPADEGERHVGDGHARG